MCVCRSQAIWIFLSDNERESKREKKKRKTKEKKKKWIYGGSDVAHIFVPLENQLNKHLSVAVLSIWLHSFHLIYVASACVCFVCVWSIKFSDKNTNEIRHVNWRAAANTKSVGNKTAKEKGERKKLNWSLVFSWIHRDARTCPLDFVNLNSSPVSEWVCSWPNFAHRNGHHI